MVKRTVTVLTLLGALALLGAVPAAGQARWDETDVQGGKEFRLVNDAGATILLQCLTRGVGAAIQLAEPVESARRVAMRGIPGGRRNVAVRQQAGGYFLSISSGPGRDFMFRMLRNAASLSVRRGRPGTVLRRVRERPDRQPVPAAAGGRPAELTRRPSLSPASLTLARDPAGRQALATACEAGTGEAVRPRNPGARRSPG